MNDRLTDPPSSTEHARQCGAQRGILGPRLDERTEERDRLVVPSRDSQRVGEPGIEWDRSRLATNCAFEELDGVRFSELHREDAASVEDVRAFRLQREELVVHPLRSLKLASAMVATRDLEQVLATALPASTAALARLRHPCACIRDRTRAAVAMARLGSALLRADRTLLSERLCLVVRRTIADGLVLEGRSPTLVLSTLQIAAIGLIGATGGLRSLRAPPMDAMTQVAVLDVVRRPGVPTFLGASQTTAPSFVSTSTTGTVARFDGARSFARSRTGGVRSHVTEEDGTSET